MPQATTTITRRDELPLAGRTMELRNFTRADAIGDAMAPLATAKMVFTSGAAVQRYDWYRERTYNEVLVVEPGAIRLERLQRGAPLLNTHNSWDLEAQLGVVENPVIAGGEGECDATFSRRPSVAGYVQDVADRVIRNVSVGYVRHKVEMVAPAQEGGVWTYRVIDWEPYEVSLVPIPADMDSQVRGAGAINSEAAERQLRTFPCEFIETRAEPVSPPTVGLTAATSTRKENSMPGTTAAGGNNAPASNDNQTAVDETRQQAAPTTDAAVQAATRRAADITSLCVRHNMADKAAAFISGEHTLDQVRAMILDAVATRDQAQGGNVNVRVETLQDDMQTRMAGMETAVLHRVGGIAKLDDNGRQYRGMSLLEMGREFLECHGVKTRGMDRMTLAQRILHFRTGVHTTSDFASLFANVANKRLRAAYEENMPSYMIWARRAPNAPDFKSMQVTQLGGTPDLLQTNEAGEFKYGTMSDGKETYSMLTYGRIVALSRQAIVNDDLRAFDRLVTAFGYSARRLENRTVYAQLTANAALSDGVALFDATTHLNLTTGAGSALSASALAAARTAMRVQKGYQSEELNLAPAYLIVPAALEQTAYQLTSNQYVPATTGAVNEFRQGGRTELTPVVESVLDANSATKWYLAASSNQIDTVEYCYLDGAEGVVIESDPGFEVDGISYKARLDFAAKAIDYRGLLRANGA